MLKENITFKIPKTIVENLKHDLRLPEETSNITVLRKAIAVSSFIATNGAFDFEENRTIVKAGDATLNLDNIS